MPTNRKSPLRILLVDDDDAVRKVIKRVLERMGHAVRACASAADAYRQCDDWVEVAMIDLNLGGGRQDGWTLLERCRSSRPAAYYVLTSGARPELPRPERGGPFFLKKPFSRPELTALLDQARLELSRKR